MEDCLDDERRHEPDMHHLSLLDREVFIAMSTALAVILGGIASMGGQPVDLPLDEAPQRR